MPIPKSSITEYKCPGCNGPLRLLWESEDLYVCPRQSTLWKLIIEKEGYLLKKIYSPSDYHGPEESFIKIG